MCDAALHCSVIQMQIAPHLSSQHESMSRPSPGLPHLGWHLTPISLSIEYCIVLPELPCCSSTPFRSGVLAPDPSSLAPALLVTAAIAFLAASPFPVK